MAMNKREQAEFAQLQRRLRRATALHASPGVPRDLCVPAPCDRAKAVRGYVINTATQTVRESASVHTAHAVNYNNTPNWNPESAAWAQEGIEQFSTKSAALQTLRSLLAEQFGEKLAELDDQIAEALKQEAEHESASHSKGS